MKSWPFFNFKKGETPALGRKQRQWLWFAGLFVGGMLAMLVLAGFVRIILRAAS